MPQRLRINAVKPTLETSMKSWGRRIALLRSAGAQLMRCSPLPLAPSCLRFERFLKERTSKNRHYACRWQVAQKNTLRPATLIREMVVAQT
jgi:hypothetical protein